MSDREPTFEDDQAELERIVERLERGDVALDELTALWERGEDLHRRLAARLEAAQGRIEELARTLEQGASDGRPDGEPPLRSE